MKDCLFCKIIDKELPAEVVFEDEKTLAFLDIHPKAQTHILIIPKEHIVSITSDGSEEIVKELIKSAKKIARDKKMPGFKLMFNVGREGGQMVDHLHLHLLSAERSMQELLKEV